MSSLKLFAKISRRFQSTIPHGAQRQNNFSEEAITRYCQGGYHPVIIGDVFNKGQYKVVCKLGYGIYSTVWLAFDQTSRQHVALKILTSDVFEHANKTFEVDILKRMQQDSSDQSGKSHILQLLDNFEHSGPNGTHICLVFQAMGPDMSKYRRLFPKLRIPIPIMKTIAKQLLSGLAYLHDSCRVIHTDIKPQNILIETPAIRRMFESVPSSAFQSATGALSTPEDFYMRSTWLSSPHEDLGAAKDVGIKLADVGTASWIDQHLTEWIQPDKLRAPEVILGSKWDTKADIWNVGLIIWELAEGQLLFDGTWTGKDDYSSEAHLAQIYAICGPMPRYLLDNAKHRDQFYDAQGNLLKPPTFPACSLEQFSKNADVSGLEKRKFIDLIHSMINVDPKQRPSARELLSSSWLT